MCIMYIIRTILKNIIDMCIYFPLRQFHPSSGEKSVNMYVIGICLVLVGTVHVIECKWLIAITVPTACNIWFCNYVQVQLRMPSVLVSNHKYIHIIIIRIII